MNLIENEDLAWERFQKPVTDEDVITCYDMSLKEFEHSAVHDLFKVCDFTFALSCHFTFFQSNKSFFIFQAMSKFIIASRQATKMDKMRIQLEIRIQEVNDDCRGWAKMAAKATDEAKELQNLVEELKANIVKKDTRLDHLQKKNDKLTTLLKKAKEDAVVEFRASKQFTDLLDTNYAASFEDFRMDTKEHFPKVDFTSVKLNIGVASSLLQTSSEDVNIEDDANTQPTQDNPTSGDNPQ